MKRAIKSSAKTSLVLTAAAVTACMSATAQTTVYSHTFSGGATALNGVGVESGTGAGTLWSANGPFRDNGTIDGTIEGGALLPFDPVAGMIYTLSLDVTMPVGVDRWVALGFAQDPLPSLNADEVNGRHPNEIEGIAWMLFRDHTDPLQEVQLFRGRRTTTSIPDTNPALTFGITHTLSIILDTTGDGTSFSVNFLIDGASVSSGAQAITTLDNPGGGATVPGNLLDQIQYVGLSFDDATGTPPVIDNFLLTQVVPEPSVLTLIGVGGLAYVLRFRRRN